MSREKIKEVKELMRQGKIKTNYRYSTYTIESEDKVLIQFGTSEARERFLREVERA